MTDSRAARLADFGAAPKLPVRIDPCPIVEAVLEIRFERKPGLDWDATPGYALAVLEQIGYDHLERLPVADVPRELHDLEPALRFNPHHRLRKGQFLVLLGPMVLALSCQPPYVGWEPFREEFRAVLDRLAPRLIQKVVRTGVRYIDRFPGNLFQHLKLSLLMEERALSLAGLSLKLPVEGVDGVTMLLRIDTGGAVGEAQAGSWLDVDASAQPSLEEDPWTFIEAAHVQQKELFFKLLKDEFLASLNPSY